MHQANGIRAFHLNFKFIKDSDTEFVCSTAKPVIRHIAAVGTSRKDSLAALLEYYADLVRKEHICLSEFETVGADEEQL
jgi:hypothetical protein